MDWLRHNVWVLRGSLLARLSALFLKLAPLLFLTVTPVMANSASAAWHQAANSASELPGVMEPRAGFDALASAGRNGESVLSFYDHASDSDDAVAARSAGIVASNGTKITGLTRHGVNRAIGDGAERAGTRPQAILDALKNPKSIKEGVDSQGRPFQIFTGADARVVVNPQTGNIVSTNPLSGAGAL